MNIAHTGNILWHHFVETCESTDNNLEITTVAVIYWYHKDNLVEINL